MPYPDFHVGESLHLHSDLTILDSKNPDKPDGQPADPISRGATGVVWLVKQSNLIERAVKILSPEAQLHEKEGDWKKFVEVFKKEAHKLASLTHSHLAKLITFGIIPQEEVPKVDTEGVGIPYIVMELIKGSPLQEFIIEQAGKEQPDEFVNVILDLFDDILSAMLYLHQQIGMHSDIKEANILVRHTHRPEAVIVDLGAAHILSDDYGEETLYVTTPGRVPKLWQDKVGTYIPVKVLRDNRVRLDLYMFGTMLRLFLNKELPEYPDWFKWRKPLILPALRRILSDLGIVVLDRVADKCLENIYSSAEEVRQDLAAIKSGFVSPLGVAELSLGTDTKTTLSLPEDSVPFTQRMTWILNHPSVQRLRNISQLDFVSMIYLGATHNRLLHSVETYNLARRYIGTLLGDPTFRAYCAEHCKLEAALLAGLLHDVGHYPLGHIFEDYAFRSIKEGPFSNILRDEGVTSALLDNPDEKNTWVRDAANQHIDECKRVLRTESISGLPDLIRKHFGEQVLTILRNILGDSKGEEKGILILRSIVNGPLDVDKVCYLRTDSKFTGASYGSAVDIDSILASITCTVSDKPGIAIREKGICAAESIATGRRWMFQRVYWHRTNRAVMAMLRFVPHYLFENNILTFPQYFKTTYSMSDIGAVKWLDKEFEEKRLDKDKHLENPALMILNGRRGIYKTLLEFSRINNEDAKVYDFLTGRTCAQWSIIANEIAKIAKAYVKETKVSDVLIDIPSKRRHDIGDPTVFRAGKEPRMLSELSAEFKQTMNCFAEALSCRIFIHPTLRKSLLESDTKRLVAFQKDVYKHLDDSATG